ncbi:MAG: tRNA (adenosine(37)-N6)-threonylcarbamoyltransferase complex ATPase subunit type 1 TsaE [Tamlana sp.]
MRISYNLNEIDSVVNQLIDNVKTKTLLFYGDMGVGKTTLIKALANRLGSIDDVSSPTFSIVNEYKLDTGSIYHFDLYRINDLEELFNFGIEDYIDSDNWKFIEWPEIAKPIISNDYDEIHLKLDTEMKRILSLN